MNNNFNPQVLNIETTEQAVVEMKKIECTSAGIAIMKDKAVFKVIKLTDINTKAANILKQTFLSKGGEVAISRHCADLSRETSDVIIMATLHQYRQAIPVLKMQPWKLKNVAAVLEEILTEKG
ncbi:dihydropteroate synthase [Megamonas hypermegale]|uniref:dihydropteroate synthase n=1 Tax=Megamonas hypermegale TaxID=158847 RepID=UPI0025A45E87|nr:dihydropteroate synthase [Megamonas hypermegale]MDM8142773.1 dihydropteroate synthase [Megamonas hypermegale]